MDSVIVFFGRSTYEQIEKAAKALGGSCNQLSRGSADVYLHRYARATWAAELDADELKLIEQFLGGPITSALEIACRHGESAHFALEVVASLMLRLSPAVLDDDFGGLWTTAEIQAQLERSPSDGIFHLRAGRR